ncbi:HD-GYP domain-containing protein [Konateibacter massiliensis]|uniref:HD-GYP domain-containing protein n=1 Tax=Konateibacter massiliensis TaxID=2002841 RepID=UPI000C151AE8|nr:HD domain-containing phosphohydrolase [Konateibacter massiliensis]
MKLKNVNDLKGGEYLARPVCIGRDIILIYEGTCLKEEYINKLRELGVQHVYIADDDAEETDKSGYKKDSIVKDYREKIRNILERHVYTSRDELAELREIAYEIIEDIINENKIVEEIENLKEHEADIYEHSINVCALSILLAIRMKLDMQLIHSIAVGSILHDIGFRYIPTSYANKLMSDLSRKDLNEFRKHTIYGYMAVEYEEWLTEESKDIILSHHERIDGSGYPLRKKEINDATKIVSICDEYDTLLCGIGCKPMKTYQIVENLKAKRGIEFEESHVDAFLDFIALYPNGTKVETNEGEIGVVIRQNSNFKERPVLSITKDKSGNNIKKEKDLLKYLNIFIERVIE